MQRAAQVAAAGIEIKLAGFAQGATGIDEGDGVQIATLLNFFERMFDELGGGECAGLHRLSGFDQAGRDGRFHMENCRGAARFHYTFKILSELQEKARHPERRAAWYHGTRACETAARS